MFILKKVESQTTIDIFHKIADQTFEDSYFEDYEIADFWKFDTDGKYFLVKLNNENIGVLSYTNDEDGIIIDTIGFLPDFRGKGFGKRLLHQLEKIFESNANWIAVEFIADDVDLFNFYSSNGFIVDRIEMFVYEDSDIIFQGGFLEFKEKFEDQLIPDFIPWVVMTKNID